MPRLDDVGEDDCRLGALDRHIELRVRQDAEDVEEGRIATIERLVRTQGSRRYSGVDVEDALVPGEDAEV